MKAKLLIVSLSLIIIAACNKDKFGSTPVLTFESINGNTFAQGQNIQIKLRLTDKEGDFYDADPTDSLNVGFTKPYLFYKRFSADPCQDINDSMTTNYQVPAFQTSKFLDAQLDIQYTYGEAGQFPEIPGCRAVKADDSTYFRIWIVDDAGHISDTITTPAIKLLKIE